jgi:hypothetical protein
MTRNGIKKKLCNKEQIKDAGGMEGIKERGDVP